MARIGVLSNPNSGKNRRRPWRARELAEAAGVHGLVRQTKDTDELTCVLEEFFDAGCEYWLCDGGDGTLHWMLSEGDRIARRRGVSLPQVLPANGGSIDFVAHKAGIRGQATDLLAKLAEDLDRDQPPPTVTLDTLRIGGRTRDGELFERIGFAAAIGGIAQRFFEKLYATGPVDPSKIAMVLANSVGSLALGRAPLLHRVLPDHVRTFADEIFAPTPAHVEIDGVPLPFQEFASLQVGSIDISLGGVVRTFRHATRRGVLHGQAACMSPLGVTANLPNIVMGTRIWGRRVFDDPMRTMDVRTLDPKHGPWLDPVIDGEMFFGLAQLRVERGPALRVPCMTDLARRRAA